MLKKLTHYMLCDTQSFFSRRTKPLTCGCISTMMLATKFVDLYSELRAHYDIFTCLTYLAVGNFFVRSFFMFSRSPYFVKRTLIRKD